MITIDKTGVVKIYDGLSSQNPAAARECYRRAAAVARKFGLDPAILKREGDSFTLRLSNNHKAVFKLSMPSLEGLLDEEVVLI